MKNLVIVFIFLLSSLLFITFFVGVTTTQPKPVVSTRSPHLYDKPNIPIGDIHLTVFYFVPKDRSNIVKYDWQKIVTTHLQQLQEFHNVQLLGTSKLTYSLFPNTIVGNEPAKYYELQEYNDNPDSLIPIKNEIEQRVFKEQGDLHGGYHAMSRNGISTSTREVYLVIFEGSGGAGNDTYSIISRSYLTDKVYERYGTTFLAHEFYHTLGLPDNYKKSTYVYNDNQEKIISIVTKKDIMGQVDIPLSRTYIDSGSLKRMGL